MAEMYIFQICVVSLLDSLRLVYSFVRVTFSPGDLE